MSQYTDINAVAEELGGVTIDNASTPSSDFVSDWITEASDEIEQLTGKVWCEKAVSSTVWEYHDYDGSGTVRLNNAPVISIDKIQFEDDGLGASSTTWTDLTEGRTDSAEFVLYGGEGYIKFHPNSTGNTPISGFKNIRVAYTYGYKFTPHRIKRLCTLMVAKRFIQSIANKSGSEEGGSVTVGPISVSDPTNYIHTLRDSIHKEIEYLMEKVVASTKVHIYNSDLF